MSMPAKIRVLIADDHELIRFGVVSLVETANDMEVCCEASSGVDCLKKFESYQPDIVLMDIAMPGIDGIETTKLLMEKYPNAVILMFSMLMNETYLERSISAGAMGYLHKNSGASELISAIRTALHRNMVFSSSVSDIIKQRIVRSISSNTSENQEQSLQKHNDKETESSVFETLTDREKEILMWVGKGLTSHEIGENLHISPRTVDTHRSKLMQKLHLKSKSEVVRFVMEHLVSTK